MTNGRKLHHDLICLRVHGWTRCLPEDTHLPVAPDPFQRQFRFVLPGYNLRPLKMEDAAGSEQLRPPGRCRHPAVRCRKAHDLLGWTHTASFAQLVAEMVAEDRRLLETERMARRAYGGVG